MEETKTEKLRRVLTLRITEDDYQALNGFNRNQKRGNSICELKKLLDLSAVKLPRTK